MEAMAAKTCVSAYDIPGVDQLIKHNETGLSVTFNDEQALCAAWLSLAENPEQQMRLAEAGEQFVLQHYSAHSMALQYQDIYASITGQEAEQYA